MVKPIYILKKKENIYLEKQHIKKINLNQCAALLTHLSGIKNHLHPNSLSSNFLNLKTSSYRFLKHLKLLKTGNRNFIDSTRFGWMLQESGFFRSRVEQIRKEKIKRLKTKVLSFLAKKTFLLPPRVSNLFVSPNLLKKLKSFGAQKNMFLKTSKNRFTLFKALKTRFGVKKVFDRRINRLSLNLQKDKKQKYKKLFTFLRRNKRSLKIVFRMFPKHLASFSKKKKQKNKLLKKLLWKRKRKMKWKRRGLFRFLRLRHRFHNKFYLPKHFEINYKTANVVYLGFLDSQSLNYRLPFWLNLRRLVSFLSS